MGSIESEDLSVTIKVIKVDSKKMTLSVFKQLPERNIIGEDLGLRGIVWGKVNYHLPKQPGSETNIVWQNGNDLYRSAVKPLRFTVEQAKRHQDNHEINLYRELAHMTLVRAVEATHEEDIQSLSELFNKYKRVYRKLVDSEQLYIAT